MRTLQFQSPSLQIEQPQNRRIILNKNFFFQSSLLWASVIRTGFKSHAMTGTWCWAVWPGLCTFWASAFHQISHHVLCRITNTVLSIHICCGQQRKKKKGGTPCNPTAHPPIFIQTITALMVLRKTILAHRLLVLCFGGGVKSVRARWWVHDTTQPPFFPLQEELTGQLMDTRASFSVSPGGMGQPLRPEPIFFGRRRILWHMLFLYLCTLVLRSTEVMGPAHRAVSCWCCRWLVLCTPAALQLLDKPDISLWLFGSAAVCIQVASSLSQTKVYIQFNLLLNTLKLYAKNKHLHLQFFASFGGPISKIERGTGKEFSLF